MASTLISIPKFFEFTHIEIENGTTKYWTSELNENAVYVRTYSSHVFATSNFLFVIGGFLRKNSCVHLKIST